MWMPLQLYELQLASADSVILVDEWVLYGCGCIDCASDASYRHSRNYASRHERDDVLVDREWRITSMLDYIIS